MKIMRAKEGLEIMSQKLSGQPISKPTSKHAMNVCRVSTGFISLLATLPPPSHARARAHVDAFAPFLRVSKCYAKKKTLCSIRLFQGGRGPTKCYRPPPRFRVAWSWCARRAREKYAGLAYHFHPAPNGPRLRPGA